MTDRATDTASAALLKDVVEEMRHRAEEGCTGTHDVMCFGEDSDIHPKDWCHRCLMGVALASLPAPATDTASAALLKLVETLKEESRRAMRCAELSESDSYQEAEYIGQAAGFSLAAEWVNAALASLPAPAAPPDDRCLWSPASSAICDRGRKGCPVRHVAPAAPEEEQQG